MLYSLAMMMSEQASASATGRVLASLFATVALAAVGWLAPQGSQGAAPANASGEVAIGATVRDATLQGLNGPPKKLSQFRGKPLIINLWASWCGPCRAETASLERLAWLEPARHFNIIGISTDDDPVQALAWLKHSNATISQFIDTRQQLENMLGASRIPLTVLVDADGRIVDRIYGAREWDSAESLSLLRQALRIP